MMDADKLNRELQIFRNHVKIARENVIHKLVRDIKFWKAKHESNAENKRATKKVESLETLIGHIKSQSASELSKAIIRFNPKKSTGSGGLEERTLMRFHENKKLQPEVKALIRRFGLSSKLEVLDKYLKNRGEGKKAKTSKKGSKKKDKLKKAPKIEKGEQESEDQGFCEADDARESVESAFGSESDEENGSEADEDQDVGKFVKLAQVKEKVVKKQPSAKNEDKQSKKKKKKQSKSPEDDDTENECVQVQDSFFVTSSGQTYVATAPVVSKKQLEQEEEEEFSWKRSNKRKESLGNRKERPQKRPLNGNIVGQENDNDLHPSWKAKQQQKGIKQFQGQRKRLDGEESFPKKSNHEDPTLHPSWAAKQKQRNLEPFAGKKIKFFDADVESKVSLVEEDMHPSWAAKQKQRGLKPFAGKKIFFDSGAQPEHKQQPAEDLHPSWAAKQKEKGLKPFQGKKIVFDSDTKVSMDTPDPSDLHPSWAAKQKQKGIQEFRGKKITFGD